ncbi:hypothetical protein PUMCH_002670 [Australozyma saopauloensis]|uniref:Peptidase S8/S53 domain-containing protein n=1 Tax=Australozyma saopauloensis TaxID=291208 RepID=A0AAX4H9W9_9ASCO|nr:hypothetical protein PUMCH_002670 [[Candida] saopauloensis]
MKAIVFVAATILLPQLGLGYPFDDSIKRTQELTIDGGETSESGNIHEIALEENEIFQAQTFNHELLSRAPYGVEDWDVQTMGHFSQKAGDEDNSAAHTYIKRATGRDTFNYFNITPHTRTGVTRIHDRGIFGKGSVIGIIDSGIDANHPSLKGRVLPGYDFTTDSPLAEGNSDSTGHGTFCASLAVGGFQAFQGVAPEANVRMYKVEDLVNGIFSQDHYEELVRKAMLRALDDKVDVLLISQGLNIPVGNSPTVEVVSRVTSQIPVIVPASDLGREGFYSGKNGAASDKTIVVGSYTLANALVYNFTLTNGTGDTSFSYYTSDGTPFDTSSSYNATIVSDVCDLEKLPADGSGSFLIGSIEECSPQVGIKAAEERNYLGLILASSISIIKNLPRNSSKLNFIGVMLNADISERRSTPKFGTIKFNKSAPFSYGAAHTMEPNYMSDFSSWGPTFDQGIYPHIVAPGGDVFGAVADGAYTMKNGTSYAAAYVAGALALYVSGNKNVSSEQIRRSLLATTKVCANTIYFLDGSIRPDAYLYDPFTKQGSGLPYMPNMFDAQTTFLSDPLINLNDTEHRVANHEIKIQNTGNRTLDYLISSLSSEVINATNADGLIASLDLYPIPQNHSLLSYDPVPRFPENEVNFSRTLFSLKPGEIGSFNVTIRPTPDLKSSLSPIFSGLINITSSESRMYYIPYMGMEFDSSKKDVWSEPAALGTGQDDKFVAATDQNGNLGVLKLPVVYGPISWGSSLMSFDLVTADYDLTSYRWPATAGDKGMLGPISLLLSTNESILFPLASTPVSSPKTYSIDSFADGTTIPKGEYKILYRALKVFGNASNIDDWSLRLTPRFTLENDLKASVNITKNSTTNGASSALPGRSTLLAQTGTSSSKSRGGSAAGYSISSAFTFLALVLAFIF